MYLLQEEGWRPSITVPQVLTGIQVQLLQGPSVNARRIAQCPRSRCASRVKFARQGGVLAAQDLLNDPNPLSPAQSEAYMMLQQQRCAPPGTHNLAFLLPLVD